VFKGQSPLPVVLARALNRLGKPPGYEINVDCMSHKDAGAKQTQDYRDHFNQLTHPRYTTG
jgi:hypothetical protein